MKRRARSNSEWIHWGKTDPMFAVATLRGTEIGGERPWQESEFLAMGERYFAAVWRQWQQYGVTPGHTLEIGCGSGRITHQLAARFERITAIDVSPDQLRLAARLLGPAAAHVSFVLVTDPVVPLPEASCDGVFSCEVFQHFDPPSLVDAYLREAYRVLKPGGSLCFHLPTRGVQPRTFLSSGLRTGILKALRRLGRRRMMIYRQYAAPAVMTLLERIGFDDVQLRAFRSAAHSRFDVYFFARKR